MDTVNSFIASNTTCQKTGNCLYSDHVSLTTLGVANFPNMDTTTQGFWSAIGFVFALLIIISVLLPLSNVIKSLVQEKETKLREGMMMMSLRGDALWLSWIMNFMLLFVPLSIILMLAGKWLFEFSSNSYIFIYFMVFFISATSYAILISTFFSNSRTAAIIGCLVFFMGFFIYIGMQDTNASRNNLLAACLHPAAAFSFATDSFAEYEDANVGVNENTWNKSETSNITFQDCLTMMFVDAIWMGILAWYVANVWPSEFGTHKPFYFFLTPSHWMNCFCIKANKHIDVRHVSQEKIEAKSSAIELVTENLSRQIDEGTCVNIVDLYKEFKTTDGMKVAVDGLNLTMFSGQITALLGHNGAGKSTAIGMLTGLIPPSAGTATVEGRDIRQDMPEIRKNLGVCPQHDILFPMLTVEEHLILFASFKGTPRSDLKEEVEKMIQSVGLTEKRKAYSKTLSGGQKRKLSVGIAFIGGSRIVILDEPTSGNPNPNFNPIL
jgi:ATP-binding cassette subfamily A (ABC1) protein 3